MNNLKPVVIFDLDGTLADIEHRLHYVEIPDCPKCQGKGFTLIGRELEYCNHCDGKGKDLTLKKDWDKFYAECVKDTPIKATIRILLHLWSAGVDIWIWTGRGEQVRKETKKWIADNVFGDIEFPSSVFLRMRKTGDKRPTAKVKQEWIRELSDTHKQRVICVLEDSPSVCDMWREEGIQVYQVQQPKF